MQIFCNSAIVVSDNVAGTELYLAPANQEVTIHNLYISNNSSTDQVTVRVKLVKVSGSPMGGTTFATGFYIASKDLPIDPLNTIELKPINLMSGDRVMISKIGTADVHAVASILKEIKDF